MQRRARYPPLPPVHLWQCLEKIVANCCTGRVYVVLVMRGALSKLAPAERNTLEIGSCLVLSVLGLGLQLGQWPMWSALVAAVGYLVWVLFYAEVTVQARRRRLSLASAATSNPPAPQPAHEHCAA